MNHNFFSRLQDLLKLSQMLNIYLDNNIYFPELKQRWYFHLELQQFGSNAIGSQVQLTSNAIDHGQILYKIFQTWRFHQIFPSKMV